MNERKAAGTLRVLVPSRACVFPLLVLLAAAAGCQRTGAPVRATHTSGSPTQFSDELFQYAVVNLNSLEDNDCSEMLRSTRERLIALQSPELAPGVLPSNALLASWPEPDMLRQVVSRLNQWVDTQGTAGAWKPDPMLESLPPDLAKLPMLTPPELGDIHFHSYDGYALMEAVWLRDVAHWAKGNTSKDLDIAQNLFDWTVRNIQLDDERTSGRLPQVPWETLFLGHGTAAERAWTYILLLRQCDIDAAILALPVGPAATAAGKGGSDAKPAAAKETDLRPFCVAVLIGEKDKKVYLFEPRLGVPIPAPNGLAGKTGQLEVAPATLDQVVADRKLLDRLATGSAASYWPASADWNRAALLLEASPLYLEPRAKRMQASLTGERKMVINAEPSPQAERFKAAGIADVRLWNFPFAALERGMAMSPTEISLRLQNYLGFIGIGGGGNLYKGRILHLKGRFFDEKGAIAYYQKARPRTRDAMAQEAERVKQFYQDQVEREAKLGHQLTPEEDAAIKQKGREFFSASVNAVLKGKIDAAYWLGLIEYEQGDYLSAIDYFYNRTLLAAGSTVFWGSGAYYNMARCHEIDGQWTEALHEYEANGRLHNDEGSVLRAQWLREVHDVKPTVQEHPADNKPDEIVNQQKTSEEKPAEETKPADKREEPKKAEAKKADEMKPADEPHERSGNTPGDSSSSK